MASEVIKYLFGDTDTRDIEKLEDAEEILLAKNMS